MSHRNRLTLKVFWSLLAAAVVGISASPPASAQVMRTDPAKTKSSESLRIIFKEIVTSADKSTVVVKGDIGENETGQVSLGTVVGEDGYILTKASEVVGRSTLTVTVAGKPLVAKLVGVSEPQDLAMLKVDATGLTVVPWADAKTDKLDVGEWVACCSAGTKDEPLAVGVLSVGRRKIAPRNGFLGVALDNAAGAGAKITQVESKSAAEKAGMQVDDIVTAVDGKPTKDRESLINAVHGFRPGDVVTLTVKRGEQMLELKAGLGAPEDAEPSRFSMMNQMAGPISKRSSDFTAVLQHDSVIRPIDCGGPLVDLTGKVIGINIARAGRTETYALPADIILPLLDPLKNGKLAPVNAHAPSPEKSSENPTTLPEKGE